MVICSPSFFVHGMPSGLGYSPSCTKHTRQQFCMTCCNIDTDPPLNCVNCSSYSRHGWVFVLPDRYRPCCARCSLSSLYTKDWYVLQLLHRCCHRKDCSSSSSSSPLPPPSVTLQVPHPRPLVCCLLPDHLASLASRFLPRTCLASSPPPSCCVVHRHACLTLSIRPNSLCYPTPACHQSYLSQFDCWNKYHCRILDLSILENPADS